MVIDEGQQYGTDREIATISLLRTQPLTLWTGDAQQTPRGLARAAPNAERSQQLCLPNNMAFEATGDTLCRQRWLKPWRSSWKTHPMRAFTVAGFEKVFRTQDWVRRSKLFCR